VLQCVTVCYSVLQCVTCVDVDAREKVYFRVLQCVKVCYSELHALMLTRALRCVACVDIDPRDKLRCSVLQLTLQHTATYCRGY